MASYGQAASLPLSPKFITNAMLFPKRRLFIVQLPTDISEGTKSCWDRPGAELGETELNRLFYRLGWIKGWYKGELRTKTFAEIRNGDQTPNWKTIKTKILDLAKKYDATA